MHTGSSAQIGALILLAAVVLSGCAPAAGNPPTQASTAPPSIAAPGSTTAPVNQGGAPTRITVAPISPSPVTWAYYFIAKPLGFYDAANLDVEVVANPPRGSQQQGLLSSQLKFAGVSSATNVPQDAAAGRLKWFLTTDMYPFGIWVAADSSYQSAKDLVGKSIGLRDANDDPAIKVMMAAGGVNASQYSTVVTGGRGPAAIALRNGEIQAAVATVADSATMEDAGVKLRQLDSGATNMLYNGGLMATNETLANERDLTVRFGRAIVKSLIWMYENPEATLDLLARVQPEAVQDRASAMAVLRGATTVSRPRYEARFRADPAVYQSQIDLLASLGVVKTRLPATDVFTNDLLDDIWNFDVQAVTTAARAGKY